MFIVETERTGPVVRVWLEDAEEAGAADAARDHLGTDALPEVVDHGAGRFEVIFDGGDLA